VQGLRKNLRELLACLQTIASATRVVQLHILNKMVPVWLKITLDKKCVAKLRACARVSSVCASPV
jgi:alpha-D-ribose 1-methylphosphonate 5-triphosphate synthase subunit PhnH